MTERKTKEISATRILRKTHERIIKNFMDILILAELRKKYTISGPGLITFFHEKSGILISPGIVYSVLYALERKGLTEGMWNGRKRVYKLTDKGEETINIILNVKEKILRFVATLL